MGQFVEGHAPSAATAVIRRPASTDSVGDRAVDGRTNPAIAARASVLDSPRGCALGSFAGRADVRGLDLGSRFVPAGNELSGSFSPHPHLSDVRAVGSRSRARCRASDAVSSRIHRLLPRACPGRIRLALRDANPSVVVIPGLGIFGFGKDKREARITTEFFVNAIHVMAGANGACRRRPGQPLANAVSQLRRAAAPEAFRIEYWALEEAKLRAAAGGKGVQPAAWRWSSAAAAASAGRSPSSWPRRGAHVVVADRECRERRRGWAEARATFLRGDGHGGGDRSHVARQHRVPRSASVLQFGGIDIAGEYRRDISDADAPAARRKTSGSKTLHDQRHEQSRPGRGSRRAS